MLLMVYNMYVDILPVLRSGSMKRNIFELEFRRGVGKGKVTGGGGLK